MSHEVEYPVWNMATLKQNNMATFPATELNLATAEPSLPSKKKRTKTRSAISRKRSARRKKKLLIQTKKLLMFNSAKHIRDMCDMQNTVVPPSPNRCMNEAASFWKSRAISLHYENQMLYKHIEEIYSNIIGSKLYVHSNTKAQIEDNQEYTNNEDENYYDNYEGNDYAEEDDEVDEDSEEVRMSENKKEVEVNKQDNFFFQPPTQNTKKREEEMKILYGTSYTKIMGMETVVQLNYDVMLDKEKINYWPVLPIKM